MDVGRMRGRCPGAELVSTGELPGWRFLIGGSGFATIAPEDGRTVRGVLWRLTAADEASLDEHEGVEEGLYDREPCRVGLADGRVVAAFLYRARDGRGGVPGRSYMEAIVAAAAGHGFPSRYVAELRGWLPGGG